MLEIVDAHRAGGGEPRLDPFPGLVLEVEGDGEVRVERPEDQLQHPLVAGADQLHTRGP